MTPKQAANSEMSSSTDGNMKQDGESDPRYLEELNFISNAARQKMKTISRVKKEEHAAVCITAAMRSHARKKSTAKKCFKREGETVSMNETAPAKGEMKMSPVITLVGLVISIVASLCLSYLYLRIGLKAFCPYDENLGAFIVMEKVHSCPERVEVEGDIDDGSCFSFFKNVEEPIELVREVPVADRGFHELLCRGTFNALSIGAALLHPKIHYDTTIPKTEVKSPCPELPQKTKRPVETSAVKKGWKAIQCMLGNKKSGKKERIPTKKSSADESGENDDWTKFVSVSPTLNLSVEKRNLSLKVKEALMLRIEGDTLGGKMLDRMGKVPYGGRFPYWYPLKDKWGADNEDSGSRTIASYMNIMNWPKNLMTNFPGSGICADGCPADFAIYNTLRFREEYQPWKMTPSAYETNKAGWMFVRGYSPSRYDPDPSVGGSSILWFNPGLYKIQDPESYYRVILNNLDVCISDALSRSDGRIAKCNVVLNCEGFGISYIPPISVTKRLLKLMQDNYPDKLGVLVIANISGASQMFLKVVLPLLPAVVRQKVHLLPNDDVKRTAMMRQLVHEPFIPEHFGGTDDYKFSANEYYKSTDNETPFISDKEGIEYYESIPYYGP